MKNEGNEKKFGFYLYIRLNSTYRLLRFGYAFLYYGLLFEDGLYSSATTTSIFARSLMLKFTPAGVFAIALQIKFADFVPKIVVR